MKAMLLAFLFSIVPAWFAGTTDEGEDGTKKCERIVMVTHDGKVEVVGNVSATATVEILEGQPHAIALVRIDGVSDGRNEGAGLHRVVRMAHAKNRGWLGVSIGNVPDEVKAQLGDIEGAYIRNVVTDSPADEAGIQAHDIILAINGDDVGNDIGRAVKLIKGHNPGDEIEIVVLRGGDELPLTVTLGSRGDRGPLAFSWKMRTGPETEVEESIRTHGKMMLRGPGGEWTFKDLGDLGDLPGLPANIRMMLPQGGMRTFQFSGEGDEKSISITVERVDGESIAVEQADGGDITVTRRDEDGNETVTVYANEDELAGADEEAYELFENAGSRFVIHLDMDAMTNLEDFDFNFKFDFDSNEFHEHMAEWQEKLHESLEASREDYEGSFAVAQALIERLHDGVAMHGLPHFLRFGADGDGADGNFSGFNFRMGKPRHTFEVRPDGTIEVKLRKGDSELVQLYDDADDLADRDPKLYRKYEELMSAGDENE